MIMRVLAACSLLYTVPMSICLSIVMVDQVITIFLK